MSFRVLVILPCYRSYNQQVNTWHINTSDNSSHNIKDKCHCLLTIWGSKFSQRNVENSLYKLQTFFILLDRIPLLSWALTKKSILWGHNASLFQYNNYVNKRCVISPDSTLYLTRLKVWLRPYSYKYFTSWIPSKFYSKMLKSIGLCETIPTRALYSTGTPELIGLNNLHLIHNIVKKPKKRLFCHLARAKKNFFSCWQVG